MDARFHNPRPRLIASSRCESALSVFTGVQWVLLFATLSTAGLLLMTDASAVADGARKVLAAAFLSYAGWRVALAFLSAPPREPAALADHALPRYTIICPLYREAGMIAQLAEALNAIDYPRDRLEAFLVLEADDEDTRVAAALTPLPPFVEVLITPLGVPRTKPRACNVALERASGDLLVIYDAEDRPDPQQLREAAARFAIARADLACLQAPLRIGPIEGWFQRQFALEYAAQFEVMMPAMARMGLPFPLGGTSNHFRTDCLREVGGWDAWNVTEDADMGFRFAARGWRIETLRAPTWEAPPRNRDEWMPQRTRWLKGYMQTWTVRTRRPWIRGWRMPLGLAVTLGVAIASAAVHGPIAAWMVTQALLAALSGSYENFRWLDGVVLLAGWWAWGLMARVGARRAGLKTTILDYCLAFAYWPLQTLAACLAVWQLLRCPFWWDKTPHRPLEPAARPRLSFVAARTFRIVGRRVASSN